MREVLLTSDGTGRAITDLFVRFGTRRPAPEVSPGNGVSTTPPDTLFPTKAFRKFLACLRNREAPAIIDVGPVVGSNVAFFRERLGCKIFVEDLYADLGRLTRDGFGATPESFVERFGLDEASVDGVLCWDLFDYLDLRSAQVVARELGRVLRPGGALLAFFNTANGMEGSYTKFVIEDELYLRHRPYGPAKAKHRALLSRDIIRMFEGLLVSDSFLLKTNTREMLFRKPPIDRRG